MNSEMTTANIETNEGQHFSTQFLTQVWRITKLANGIRILSEATLQLCVAFFGAMVHQLKQLRNNTQNVLLQVSTVSPR